MSSIPVEKKSPPTVLLLFQPAVLKMNFARDSSVQISSFHLTWGYLFYFFIFIFFQSEAFLALIYIWRGRGEGWGFKIFITTLHFKYTTSGEWMEIF